MTPAQMRARTKRYALDIMGLVSTLPRSYTADVIGKQLVRCATSVGANYRAACRARSAADFIAKMKIVEEEADESLYWMELLRDGGFASAEQLPSLLSEGHEIVAIVVASIKTKRSQI
jgi:four helix bundle protein